jgi:hypothetical protein
MLAMYEDIGIGLAFCVVGILLVFIGMPKNGVTPRFLRFDAAVVLYPAVVLTFLAFGGAQILRAL